MADFRLTALTVKKPTLRAEIFADSDQLMAFCVRRFSDRAWNTKSFLRFSSS